MTLALYTHPAMADHEPGLHPERGGHPERPQRLAAVLGALEEDASLRLDRRPAREAVREELERVHAPAYLDALERASPSEGRVSLDPDTVVSPGSLRAARLAAGAVIEAALEAAAGRLERAFCAVRPPGHHAEPDRAMGFCLYSSVALAARAAQAAGLARVAVVDFDVHHGNGTQAAVEAAPGLCFASVHQHPLYPGTGLEADAAEGRILNRTVPPGAPPALWRRRFEELVTAVADFAPDLVIVSAGFDAHARDPLAQQTLEAEDFAWATRAVVELARGACGGRVVSALEGGYDLEALGRSARAHARALAAE